jgi:osmotically-inducible protein OsmY
MSPNGMPAPRPPKSDRDIQSDVLAQLNADGRLRPAEVGVEVADGVVTLTGTVSCHSKVDAASEIAVRVSSVHDVANEMAVDGERHGTDDAKIAHTIRHALGWNSAVPADRVDAIIRRGVVTLRGHVDRWYERRAAEETVASVAGVVSVRNQLRLLSTPTTDEALREEVEDALSHLPSCDQVDVHVAAGVVTLAGVVGSDPMRRQAETLVASACGVRSVINHMRTHEA